MGSAEDIARIRTLDMEIHFSNSGLGEVKPQANDLDAFRKWITRKVETMEELAKVFAVTGSSLRKYFDKQAGMAARGLRTSKEAEPWVYTSEGYAVVYYEISYVNRAFLVR